MKIAKFGHSCLLVEENKLRILIDPGVYSSGLDKIENINIILITHEHPDHCDLETLAKVIRNNPNTRIITNDGVGRILVDNGIPYELTQNNTMITQDSVTIESFDDTHAIIYPTLPSVKNSSFLIGKKLFHPGDQFVIPVRPVAVLALPVAGPWLKISESIDYARTIQPKTCIPIHDGFLKQQGLVHRAPKSVLEPLGIDFLIPENNQSIVV
ncbi:MAG: MBL fold metallo-hydrolase [Patescibacteria group bacterium]|jgi:L-ascorbate metabolism protein UlaG (beta-lactamase superfamily)